MAPHGRGAGGRRGRGRCLERHPADAGVGAVPDDPRQLGDERVDRDRRRGRRHDRHRHPDRHHLLHAGHGGAHDHRRQGRGILGRKRAFAIGCVIYGAGSFTTSHLAEPDRADHRLVGARGHRRRADHAGDRRAGRIELRAVRASPRVRSRRRRRGHRGGRGTADRRPVHHLPLVAARLRGRGRDRPGDPVADAPDGRHATGPRRATRPGRHARSRRRASGLIVFGILRAGTWGVVQPKDGAPVWFGLSPVIWLFTLGGAVLVAFVLLGAAPHRPRRGRAHRPRRC